MKFMKFVAAIAICLIFVASAVLSASIASAGNYAYTTTWTYGGNPVTNIRALNYVCMDSTSCNVLGTKTQDSNSGASNSITVTYPITSNSVYGKPYGYATYWLAPGYRYMEMAWNPGSEYSGHSASASFNFLKAANCGANITSVTAAASVNENEPLNITVRVLSSLKEDQSHLPLAEPSDADIVRDYLSSQTRVTLTIRDALNNVVYTNSSENYILEDTNLDFNFSWTPDYTQSGSYTITASTDVIDSKCSSTLTRTSTPSALTVNNVNRAPVLDAIGDKNGFEGSNLNFTISATDPDNDTLSYSMTGLPSGATLDSTTGEFSWTPNYTEAGVYSVAFTAGDGSLSDSETITITIGNVDVEAPQYSNLTENPASPVVYVDDASYEFGATWTDDVAVDSVWVNFNGVDYPAVGSGDVYTFTIADLGAANYSYQWFANDSSGNMNQTAVFTYEIQKSTIPTTVEATPASPITYGTLSNFSCTNGGILYINGVDATAEKGLDVLRGAANYTVNCTNPESENYSESSDEITYVIDKAYPVLKANLTSPITYETASDYAGWEENSGDDDLTYELYLDGALVDSGSLVSDNSVLGVGTHTYNYTTLGGENYTAGNDEIYLVVNQAIPPLAITLEPNTTVAQGTETTASELGCPAELESAGLCIFERDGTPVSGPDVQTLGAGVYNYTYSTVGNENYTSSTVTAFLTVTKISPNLQLFLNGAEADDSIVYGTESNASAFSTTSDVELYRDGVLVSDEDVATLGAGVYNYTAYALENENYTSLSVSWTLTVTQATPILSLSILPDTTVDYLTATNITASGDASQLAYTLTRNGANADAENGVEVVLPAGVYNYTYSTAGNENYTAAEVSENLTVNKVAPDLHLYLNDAESDDSIVYGTESNASAFSATSEVDLYRNGALVSDEELATLGVGAYNYTAVALENENYTSLSVSWTLTVTKANGVVSLVFDKATPQDFGTTINATCSIVAGEGSVQLFRNGSDVTSENGLDVLLGAGSWDYSCFMAETENFTADDDNATFVISAVAPDLHLFLNGAEADDSIVYGAESNASAFSTTSEVELYRNGVLVNDEETATLGAGVYNYSAIAVANQNYTEGTASWNLTVGQASPVLSLSILPSSSEVYGTETNASGSGCPAQLTCSLARNGAGVSNPDVATLGAGVYNYTYSTAGNENYTAAEVSENLTIAQAIPVMTYFLNGATANLTLVYGASVNASAYTNAGTVNVFRDGADVSGENGLDVVLGAGTYTYEFNVTGNENYTDVASEFLTLTVDKAAAQTSLVFNRTSPQTYGEEIAATCSRIAGENDVVLLRDGVDVTSTENGVAVLLGAGTHDYNCSIAESENYTAAENLSSFVINKAVPVLSGSVTSPITYGAASDYSGSESNSGDDDLTYELYLDGALIDSGSAVSDNSVLSAGNHTYNYTTAGGENYTSASRLDVLEIAKATTSLGLSVAPSTNESYGTATTATGSGCPAELTCALTRNGANADAENGVAVTLPAGVWNYTYSTAGNENYTADSISENLTINKIVSSCSITSNSPVTYDDPVNVTASCDNPEASLVLYRNGVAVTAENGVETIVGAGTWTYNATVVETENYTAAEAGTVVIVNQATPVLSLGITPSNSEVYGTATTATGSGCPAELTCTLTRNGANADAENGVAVTLGAGSYSYNYSTAGNQNWTAMEASDVLAIAKAVPVMTYSVNGGTANLTLEDPAAVNATVSSDAGAAHMFRNGVNADAENSIEQTLHLGTYTYGFNVTGNENWTDVASEFVTVDVVDTTVPQIEFVDPTRLSGRYVINTFEFNVSATDLNLANITIYVWDEVAGVLNNSFTCTSSPCYKVFTFPESNMSVNASATDLSGNTNWTEDTREYDIDTVRPRVQYESPTPSNNSFVTATDMINVSAMDVHLDGIAIYLYDENKTLLATNGYAASAPEDSYAVDFSGLGDGVYYFNATGSDSWGWSNRTVLRRVIVDTTAPSVTDLHVLPPTVWNTESVTISANVSDLNGVASVLAEITLPDATKQNVTLSGSGDIYSAVYSNTAQNGTFNARITATDNAGNVNSTEDTDFTVDYAEIAIVNSWIYGGWYPSNFTFQVSQTSVTNSTITDSTVSGTPIVNISHSLLDNSVLTNVGIINYCTVIDSTVNGGTCDHAYIDPSTVINSNTTGSTVKNSNITDSNATYSYIENSTLDSADANNSRIVNGTAEGSAISDSNVTDSSLSNSSVTDGAVVENSTLRDSNVSDSDVNDSIMENVVLNSSTVTGSNLSNSSASDSVLDNATLEDVIVYGVNVTNGNVTNLTENATFTYNGTTANVTVPLGVEYYVNFGPNASLEAPVSGAYVGDSVTLDASGTTDPNLDENGTNLALTFTENLTYTYYGWNENEGFVAFTPIVSHSNRISTSFGDAANYSVWMVATDVFGETSESVHYRISVVPKPRSSGGGGGGISCYTNWTCSDWGSCENGTMTRICSKNATRCAIKEAKPVESMLCVKKDDSTKTNETEEEKKDGGILSDIGSKITDALGGEKAGQNTLWIAIFVAAVLAAGGILWLAKKKAKIRMAKKSRKK